jgi:hypothetical protein
MGRKIHEMEPGHIQCNGLLLCTGEPPHIDTEHPMHSDDCTISVGYVKVESMGMTNPKYACPDCIRLAPEHFHERQRHMFPAFYEEDPTEEFVLQVPDDLWEATVDNQIRKTYL